MPCDRVQIEFLVFVVFLIGERNHKRGREGRDLPPRTGAGERKREAEREGGRERWRESQRVRLLVNMHRWCSQ